MKTKQLPEDATKDKMFCMRMTSEQYRKLVALGGADFLRYVIQKSRVAKESK